ncbi:MAG: M48 family metalloprotease [Granulosicoccus sp.]
MQVKQLGVNTGSRGYSRLIAFLGSFLCVISISACVQNPVTGKRDFLVVDEGWELQIGAQQYMPLRQQQGGDYIVDPKVENYVRSVGMKLAAKSDRKLPYEFNVINDSTPNAWALPGGKISINRGLLVELGSEAELAAVLGHEIVHAAAKHGAKGATRGMGLQLGVVTATILAQQNGYDGQVAQLASSVGAQIINSQYGQGAELESDRYGMEYMARAGYNPQGAVELQRTFLKLSQGQPNNPLNRLFASHPPSQKRVNENIKTAAKLPKTGTLGEREYKQAMATLFKTQNAYKAHRQAQVEVRNGNLRQASTLLSTAIRIEPRESLFHSLAGDIALSQNNLSAARKSYDKAISLNGEYFYNYVQRGRIHEAQNNIKAAQADYARSLRLLPTATAQLGLGLAAEKQGKTQVARRYYSMAAQAGDSEGQRARQALGRLQPDTSSNSRNTSLLVRQGLSRNGEFVIEIINQTANPVRNIKLGVTMGSGPQRQLDVSGVVNSGDRRMIETGQKFTQAQANAVKVVILSAAQAGR